MVISPDLLIVSTLNDSHTAAVEWAMRIADVSCYTWMPADTPDAASLSVRVGEKGEGMSIDLRRDREVVRLSAAKLVWNRRRAFSVAPNGADPSDASVIEAECEELTKGALALLETDRPVINTNEAKHKANRKILQLKVAMNIGFRIPPTLFSNDLDEVKQFCREGRQTIGKTSRPHFWVSQGRQLSPFTFLVPPMEELDPRAVELCPLIYQERVQRRSEVRLFVFGRTLTAVQTLSEEDEGDVDGRVAAFRLKHRSAKIVEVPEELKHQCFTYLDQLGLDMGAFDFIVDQDQQWTFLECNEAGQFLYLEQLVPETQLLARFCQFLSDRGGLGATIDPEKTSMAEFKRAGEWQRRIQTATTHKFLLSGFRPTFEDGSKLKAPY